MRNQRGSALVQYLMFIALVSAIAVPILVDRFGQPLIQTFQNERGKFVQIIGQTPKGRQKPPVPAEWFSKAPLPKIESEEIEGGQQLTDGQEIRTGEIKGGSSMQVGQGGGAGGGSAIEGGQEIQIGSAGGGDGGGVNRYSGAGTSGSGGSAGGDDFFSTPPKTPGGKSRGEGGGDEDQAGGSRKGFAGGDEGSSMLGGDDNVGSGQKKQQNKGKEESEGTRLGEGKKRSLVDAEQEVNERAKSKQFDWWLIVKILIVLLIVALIFLIVIGNSRK